MFPRLKLFTAISFVGTLGFSSIVFITPAKAFSVDFENDYADWTESGDTSIQETFQTIAPRNGSNQALLTTACPSTAIGDCVDTQSSSQPRNDDAPASAGYYNYSGNAQTNASVSPATLQSFLGLSANAFSIPRTGGQVNSGFRTPKEGSAIRQTVTVTASNPTIQFKWNFLTNDESHSILGDQDLAFVTIYRTDSDEDDRTIQHLADTGSTLNPGASGGFQKNTGYRTFTSGLLDPGEYVVGVGIVDTDGVGRSSGLLLDATPIPFAVTPGWGLGILAGIFGVNRLQRKLKRQSDPG